MLTATPSSSRRIHIVPSNNLECPEESQIFDNPSREMSLVSFENIQLETSLVFNELVDNMRVDLLQSSMLLTYIKEYLGKSDNSYDLK